MCSLSVLFQMSELQDDMFPMHCAQVISQNVVRNKSFVAIGFLAVELQFWIANLPPQCCFILLVNSLMTAQVFGSVKLSVTQLTLVLFLRMDTFEMFSVNPVLMIFQNWGPHKLLFTSWARKLRFSYFFTSPKKVFVVLVSFEDVAVHRVKGFELDVTQWARVIFGCWVFEIFELQLSVIIICVILQDTLRDEPFPAMFMLPLKYQIRILQSISKVSLSPLCT